VFRFNHPEEARKLKDQVRREGYQAYWGLLETYGFIRTLNGH